MWAVENERPSAGHSGKQGSLFLVIPDIFHRESLRPGHDRCFYPGDPSGLHLGTFAAVGRFDAKQPFATADSTCAEKSEKNK